MILLPRFELYLRAFANRRPIAAPATSGNRGSGSPTRRASAPGTAEPPSASGDTFARLQPGTAPPCLAAPARCRRHRQGWLIPPARLIQVIVVQEYLRNDE